MPERKMPKSFLLSSARLAIFAFSKAKRFFAYRFFNLYFYGIQETGAQRTQGAEAF